MLPNAPVVGGDCLERPTPHPADHAIVCNTCTKGVMMRHDLLLGAWRRIVHPAGVVTAKEPAMEQLWAGTGRASMERGDMLVVLPDEGLVVTDVSVVHPAPNSFLQQADTRQVRQPPRGTQPSPANTVVAGRWQAAPSIPYPWSPTGALASRRCSFCDPGPRCYLLCDGWVRRRYLLLCNWSSL
jgi:hypothetical protein